MIRGEKWYREISREQWRVLAAAQTGWILDAMDVLLYSFALTTVRAEFQLSSAAAGALAAAPLVTSACGGVLFGYLSDRFGRARSLSWSILIFSLFTALTATAQTAWQLAFWRAVVGIGLGGEWAVGSVLVAESWPARHRAKGIGLMQSGWAIGYMLAALLAALVLPRWGWRPLFLLGILPAFFTWWIRRSIPEPAVWQKQAQSSRTSIATLLRPPLRRRLVLLALLCSCLLFGYWGLFTWIPTYLSTPVAAGRRRPEHREVVLLDSPHAGRRILRLRFLRLSGGSLRTAFGLSQFRADHRRPRAGLRTMGPKRQRS